MQKAATDFRNEILKERGKKYYLSDSLKEPDVVLFKSVSCNILCWLFKCSSLKLKL